MSKQFINKISFHIQRRAHNIKLRNFLSGVHRMFLPKIELNVGLNSLQIVKDEDSILNDLKSDGFSDLGFPLNEQQIEAIMGKLATIQCYNTEKETNPIVDLNNPTVDAQLANYRRKDLVEFSEIMEIANDSKVLNVVAKYLGVKPTISNINCWWSFGNRDSAKEAQFYHRDLDDYKFLKMFFYLTDVNENSGPHIYVKGSHKSNKLNELRRFRDEEVAGAFNSYKITTLVKPKGACFLEDTYGIHKGQLPLTGNRLILQVQYSFMPLYVEEYVPQTSILLRKLKLDKYINRLLVTT